MAGHNAPLERERHLLFRIDRRNAFHRRAAARAVAFSVTPFQRDEAHSIDWDAFREEIDRLVGSGLAALVVAGGTGELFSLTPVEVVAPHGPR